jgi:restriction endonuclease S subunit
MENYKIISVNLLEGNDRWLINTFLNDNNIQDSFQGYKMVTLGEFLKERKESLDPQEHKTRLFNYLGLENIQPFTGYLVDFKPKLGKEIKSRCKVFHTDDFLFGRLRPTLNKSILIDEKMPYGICSTEFLVFELLNNVFNPIVLRYLIVSNFVQKQIKNYIAGAALPRIQVDDFLSINIPLIDYDLQLKLSHYLQTVNNEYREYYHKLNMFENNLNNSLIGTIEKQELIKITP